MQIQKSLLITLAFCGASMLSAQTWLDDSFTSGSAGTTGLTYIGSSGLKDAGTAGVQNPPSSAVWFGNNASYSAGTSGTSGASGGANPISYVPNSGIQFTSNANNGTTNGQSDSVTAFFTAPNAPQSIAIGDTLDVSVTFSLTGTINADASGLKFAIYNSGSTGSTSNQITKNTGNGVTSGVFGSPALYSGYEVTFNPAAATNTAGPVVNIFNRAPSTNNSEYLASTTAGKYNQLGYNTNLNSNVGLSASTTYTATLAITNNLGTSNSLQFFVDSGSDTNPLDALYSSTVSDTGAAGSNTANSFANSIVDSFDTFSFGEHSLETANILVSNVDIAVIPEPSTYAAILGVATLGFVLVRSRRQRRQQVIAS
jgi:hypothetical protein